LFFNQKQIYHLLKFWYIIRFNIFLLKIKTTNLFVSQLFSDSIFQYVYALHPLMVASWCYCLRNDIHKGIISRCSNILSNFI